MTDDEAAPRRCAEEARRLMAELDRMGLGYTPAALHLALAADDLELRSGTAPANAAVYSSRVTTISTIQHGASRLS